MSRSVFGKEHEIVTLTTRDGSEFEAKRYTEDLNFIERSQYDNWHIIHGIQRLYGPTNAFDGHSYAWYMRSTENEYYFDSMITSKWDLA